MRVRLALLSLAAALIATTAATAAPAATPKLVGVVGINDAFKITLKDSKGKTVKTLKSGFYKLVVTDGSSIHNFQIEGPGLDKRVTTVNFKGTKTVRIHLRKGKYKYYCMPHEGSMFGFFKVT